MLDSLASIAILHRRLEYLALADGWSLRAVEILPDCATLRGTRGAVLVELGRYEEGTALLLPFSVEESPPADRAYSACFLALAELRSGRVEAGKRWFATAREIDPSCHLLQRVERELGDIVT